MSATVSLWDNMVCEVDSAMYVQYLYSKAVCIMMAVSGQQCHIL